VRITFDALKCDSEFSPGFTAQAATLEVNVEAGSARFSLRSAGLEETRFVIHNEEAAKMARTLAMILKDAE
jgi:hypothetical protein